MSDQQDLFEPLEGRTKAGATVSHPPSMMTVWEAVDIFCLTLKAWMNGPVWRAEHGMGHISAATVFRAATDVMVKWDQAAAKQGRYMLRKENDLEPLFTALGADDGVCKACRAPIRWVRTKNGRPMPINPWGTPHHMTCPRAQDFRRGGAK